jgi:hypothetical protein
VWRGGAIGGDGAPRGDRAAVHAVVIGRSIPSLSRALALARAPARLSRVAWLSRSGSHDDGSQASARGARLRAGARARARARGGASGVTVRPRAIDSVSLPCPCPCPCPCPAFEGGVALSLRIARRRFASVSERRPPSGRGTVRGTGKGTWRGERRDGQAPRRTPRTPPLRWFGTIVRPLPPPRYDGSEPSFDPYHPPATMVQNPRTPPPAPCFRPATGESWALGGARGRPGSSRAAPHPAVNTVSPASPPAGTTATSS